MLDVGSEDEENAVALVGFFPTIMMEIRTFQLRTGPRGAIFKLYNSIFRGPVKWDWFLLI